MHPSDTQEGGSAMPTLGVQEVEHACAQGIAAHATVLDDGVVRVRFVRGAPWPERGYTHDTSGFMGPTRFSREQHADTLTLHTAALDVMLGPGCAFDVTSTDGRTLFRTLRPLATNGSAVSIARTLADGERIFGLGERTGSANRRGRIATNWNSDPAWLPEKRYSPTTDPLYQSHPFALSMIAGKASAVYLANTHRTEFDVGASQSDALAIAADDGELDLFVLDGPRPADVLERYTRLVGRTPLPPTWALGYHQARWSYTPDTRVREVAETFRAKKLPADGLWLDIDYMDGYRSFTWNPRTFAKPAELVSGLEDLGFKVTTILDPGIKQDPDAGYGAFDRGMQAHAFIVGADGAPVRRKCWPEWAVFPDFSSASARAFWGQEVADLLATSGVRGTWIDMNEPAVFHAEGFPNDARVAGDGSDTTFQEIKNVYASLMAQATYEGALSRFPDRRPFVLTRAGFAGIQKYAAVWTGDAESEWETLAMIPAQLQGLSVSGVPFVGSDVGGFTGAKSPEMYARWFELGTFSPFFRSHVMQGAPDQEPWAFGEEVEAAARELLAVRYAMLPYWVALFVEASESGAPPLRPLWWEAPEDDASYAHEDEFFVGPSLLVAPVTKPGVTSRSVYLPPGSFVDVHTGARFEGPCDIEVPAPLGRVPTFARAGAVMPSWTPRQYVGDAVDPTLFLDIFAGPSGSTGAALVVDDDGESLAYRKGMQSRRVVTTRIDDTGTTLSLAGRTGEYTPPARNITVRVHGLASAPSRARMNQAPIDVAWDAAARVASISFAESAAAVELRIEHDAEAPMAKQVDIAFTFTLPDTTPDGPVYLASDALGWKPDGLALTRTGLSATGSLSAPEGRVVQYKLTRGAWTSVEKTSSCGEIENRRVTAALGARAEATIARWSDQCP